jgi:tripartite-type tricarboxylate transporter receptor subunit TctC
MAMAFTAVLAAFPLVASADEFPSQPVRIIVPLTPGGSNDVLARVLAERLSVLWKQAVVVDNRPGASGNIGADVVARAQSDGYTL